MKKNIILPMTKKYSAYLIAGLLFQFTNFISFIAKSQSPGGIISNNTMWLRSDIGLTSNAAGAITQWQELSGANVTGDFTTQPLGSFPTQTNPTLLSAGINFNPYVSFDGVNNSLSSLNSIPGNLLVTNSSVTVFQVFNLKGGTSWLNWQTDGSGSIARVSFQNSGGKVRFDFPKAVPLTAGMNVGVTNVLNNHSLSTCYAEPNLSTNRLNGVTDHTIPIPGPGNFAAATKKVNIGNNAFNNLPAHIDIAEVVIYSRTLTAAERNKVESYLAVKYGFTLDQAAVNANDYTSANNSIIWDRTANDGYANDITGIGRDDASGLSQKQSKSINTTALLTLYNGNTGGTFPALNADNNAVFSSDGSFLLVGDNAGSTALSGCTSGNRVARIGRTWKSQVTGTGINQVTIAVNTADVPSEIKRILVSQDPAFPAAATSFYSLTAGTDKLYAAVTLDNNDYFTFGTDSLQVTLVPVSTDCSNQNGGQISATVSGGSQPYSYLWTPSGQATANLTAVAAGTYTLTVTHAGCQYSQDATIVFNDNLTLTTNTNSQLCAGNSLNTTTASNATNFAWSPVNGVSDPSIANPVLSPNSTTTYTLTATLGTCTSSQSFTVSVVPPITVNAGADISILSGQTVQLQGSGPPGIYAWTPATGLSNPAVLNPVASPASTTTYTLTITTNEGCVGADDIKVDVSTAGCGKPMNAITPNGDGINDKWLVTSNCPYTAKVSVFNRYGSKVYESATYQNDWQGTYKGKPLPDGTYYFVIEIKYDNGRTNRVQGDLTILR